MNKNLPSIEVTITPIINGNYHVMKEKFNIGQVKWKKIGSNRETLKNLREGFLQFRD